MEETQHRSVESGASWRAAWVTLAILSISFGSPLLIVVGMKPMQEALGTERSLLALAGSLVWVGTGAGGILMGWLATLKGVESDGHMPEGVMAICRAAAPKRSLRDRLPEDDRNAAGRPNPLALGMAPRFALTFLSLQTAWRFMRVG